MLVIIPTKHSFPNPLSIGTAGMANWTAAIAQDVLKSRLQTSPEGTYPRGVRDVFKQMVG